VVRSGDGEAHGVRVAVADPHPFVAVGRQSEGAEVGGDDQRLVGWIDTEPDMSWLTPSLPTRSAPS
jgi:hypothetical protein